MDVQTARIEALRANIRRYSQLLTTELTDVERAFIHRRIAEDRMALEELYAPSLSGLTPQATDGALALRPAGP